MARPSLKETRTQEILDAFMRCVARYGVEGSTLERIAEEAGVRRTLLRHYLGNRDELVGKLIDHVIARFDAMRAALLTGLPDTGRWEVIFDQLFDQAHHAPADAAVYQALVAASARHPELREPLLTFVTRLERGLAAELQRAYPDCTAESCAVVAGGITSIYFSVDSLLPLEPDPEWIARQRQAAERLVDSLKAL